MQKVIIDGVERILNTGAFVREADPRDWGFNDKLAGAAEAPRRYAEYTLNNWIPTMVSQVASSCVAQSSRSISSYYEQVQMASNYVYAFGRPNGPNGPGMYTQDALDFWLKNGNVTYMDCPGDTEMTGVLDQLYPKRESLDAIAKNRKIAAYMYICGNNGVKRNDDAVMVALEKGYPILAVVGNSACFYSTTKSGTDYICAMDPKGSYGESHAVVIMGYKYINNKLYWRVMNSWGTWWGDKGYCWCEADDSSTWSHMWAISDTIAFADKPIQHSTVRKGDKGEEVKVLQSSLTSLGYSIGAADGIFGAKTETACKDLQSKNGLTADGIVGSKTWAVIDKKLENLGVNPEPILPNDEWNGYPTTMQVRTYTSSDRTKRIGKYFTVADLWLDSAHTSIKIHDNLVKALDTIMDHYQADRLEWSSKNSIYRTVASNKACRGADNSQHLYGTAADFWVIKNGVRLNMEEVAAWIEKNISYVRGIGIYNGTHMHIDVRTGNRAYWWIVTDNSNTPGFGGIPAVFKTGTRSPANKKIQKFLNDNKFRDNNGIALTVDGNFGAKTAEALKKYQKSVSLSADGVYGSGTNAKTKIFDW